MSKLKDIGKIVTGKTPLTSDKENYGEGYMFIGPSDLHVNMVISDSEKHITRKGIESIKNNSIDGLSVLVGCIGWDMGNVAIVEGKCATNQQINAITNFSSEVNPYYIYYWLKGKKEFLFQKANVTRTPILNKSDFSDIEIELPSIKIQNVVADTLKVIDLKIENNNKINMELECMAKTIYDYWFLQFEFPNEDGKPYKSSGGKMVWNEELKREIPEGWKICKVKDCIIHINTGLNPRDNFVLGNGDIKYITVKNLTIDGNLDFLNCDTINENAKEIVHRRSDISKGDILFASIAPLGRCFLIQEEPVNWDINESVFSIRPNYNNMTSEYLYMFFMSPYFIKKAEHNSIGSVFNGIRISTLENMSIIVPPDKIMNQFKNSVHHILFSKNHRAKESTELEALRNFLLPLLMNGQVGFKV